MNDGRPAASHAQTYRVGRGRRAGFTWTRENILYALDLWSRRHLRAPTADEWKTATDDSPCLKTVYSVFGSWNRALRSAGLRPRPRGGRRPGTAVARCPRCSHFVAAEGCVVCARAVSRANCHLCSRR